MKRFLLLLLAVGLVSSACQKNTCPAFSQQESRKKAKTPKNKKKLYAKDRDVFGNKR
jgi:hypothetical protein